MQRGLPEHVKFPRLQTVLGVRRWQDYLVRRMKVRIKRTFMTTETRSIDSEVDDILGHGTITKGSATLEFSLYNSASPRTRFEGCGFSVTKDDKYVKRWPARHVHLLKRILEESTAYYLRH